jgi:hypothetical protein
MPLSLTGPAGSNRCIRRTATTGFQTLYSWKRNDRFDAGIAGLGLLAPVLLKQA